MEWMRGHKYNGGRLGREKIMEAKLWRQIWHKTPAMWNMGEGFHAIFASIFFRPYILQEDRNMEGKYDAGQL
jgi:hypothetical protein